MSLMGVDLSKGQVYPESDVKGIQRIKLVDRLNSISQNLIDVSTDEIYQVMFGQNNDYIFDYENSEVIKYYNPVFLEDRPLRVEDQVDLSLNLIFDRPISESTDRIIIFINGYACYEGQADGTIFTPFTSTVPDEERDNGYIFMAADETNVGVISFIEDRVKMTFAKLGGGSIDVWISLPVDRNFDAGELLFWDRYSGCYKDRTFNRSNFLSSFSIFDPSQFDQGAIANELYYLEGYGRQSAEFLNFQNADGFDLTALGEKWYGVKKREGETDENYKDRLVSQILGEKTTRYAIESALRVFSPNFVEVLEGLRGFGAYGRSFYEWGEEVFPGSGPYTDIVTPAYYGSITGALFKIRIKIESNPVTEDPINARFIFELVQSIVLSGVIFQIEKVVLP